MWSLTVSSWWRGFGPFAGLAASFFMLWLMVGSAPADGDIVANAKEVLADGDTFIIADLEPTDLLAVADLPEAKNSVIMNIRSSATKLRQEECRPNVFHIIPDWAMRADALAQYLIWKKWPRWYVLRRDGVEDQDYLAQVKRAAAPVSYTHLTLPTIYSV